MGFVREYAAQAPERSAVEAQAGLQVLEFGTDWCGHCIAAQPLLQKLLGGYDAIDYRKIEDGKGRPLGRPFASHYGPPSSCCAMGRNWRVQSDRKRVRICKTCYRCWMQPDCAQHRIARDALARR